MCYTAAIHHSVLLQLEQTFTGVTVESSAGESSERIGQGISYESSASVRNLAAFREKCESALASATKAETKLYEKDIERYRAQCEVLQIMEQFLISTGSYSTFTISQAVLSNTVSFPWLFSMEDLAFYCMSWLLVYKLLLLMTILQGLLVFYTPHGAAPISKMSTKLLFQTS